MKIISERFSRFCFVLAVITFNLPLSVNSFALAVENKLVEAIALHNHGRDGDDQATAAAIKLLEEIIKTEPKNVTALTYLGSSYAITARDSKIVADKMRYTNRGLRFLDQAIVLEPNNFVSRLIRANVANNLPAMFGRQGTAIEDGLMLDRIFSNAQNPKMASPMIGIYEMLSKIADGQGDWTNKASLARELAKSN